MGSDWVGQTGMGVPESVCCVPMGMCILFPYPVCLCVLCVVCPMLGMCGVSVCSMCGVYVGLWCECVCTLG